VPKLPWLVILRVATLIALAASAALLADYTADSPSFCSAQSGCGAVRASEYARVQLQGGSFVPLPALGLIGFAVLYAASLVHRRAALSIASFGGAVALWLLWVQAFVLKQFCWLCVTADVSALAAAVAAWGLRSAAFDEGDARRLRSWAWWGLGTLALAAPLLWPGVKAAPAVPGGVLARFQPGKINVVEFADFQCPACRRFHPVLKPILKKYGDRVHFVRLNKPLDSHAYALDAARAAICGEAQGQAEPTADALFNARDLSPAAIDRLAQELGLDTARFASCLVDPATSARIERESALLVPPEFEGLPTTYVGGKRLLGVRTALDVEDALERAARGEGVTGIPWFVYLPLVLAVVAVLVLRGRSRSEP
jgi:uncharacterized membrane protein/predicted DsbA family dithiol-disulfide isomerase